MQWYDSTAELLKAIGLKMSLEEFEKIEQFQKDSTTYKSNPKRVEQKLKLEDYFYNEIEAILKRGNYRCVYHFVKHKQCMQKIISFSG